MPIATKYVFIVSMDVSPEKEALFNEVYRRAKREAIDFYGGEVEPAAPLKGRVRSVWNRMLDHRLRRHDQVRFMEQFVGSSFMMRAEPISPKLARG